MALDTLASPTHQTPAAVEPSRAWILGLVVESDGSVSGPASERALEWPSCEWHATAPSTTSKPELQPGTCHMVAADDDDAARPGPDHVEDLPESTVV